jgi:hypothetical protein
MIQNPTTILSNILDIVNYLEDKQAFINQFSETCIKKGLADVQSSLPEDSDLISKDQYKKAIQDATSDLFLDFLKSIEPTLTTDQSYALDNYLASL